jgi:Domain of unknown function (DUF5664)
MEEQVKKATKHDGGKPSVHYIPTAAMFEMGRAFGYGAKKYGGWNYKEGMEVTRLLAASIRHVYKYLAGYDLDSESGISHLGHALASLAIAVDLVKTDAAKYDDRPKKGLLDDNNY